MPSLLIWQKNKVSQPRKKKYFYPSHMYRNEIYILIDAFPKIFFYSSLGRAGKLAFYNLFIKIFWTIQIALI